MPRESRNKQLHQLLHCQKYLKAFLLVCGIYCAQPGASSTLAISADGALILRGSSRV